MNEAILILLGVVLASMGWQWFVIFQLETREDMGYLHLKERIKRLEEEAWERYEHSEDRWALGSDVDDLLPKPAGGSTSGPLPVSAGIWGEGGGEG